MQKHNTLHKSTHIVSHLVYYARIKTKSMYFELSYSFYKVQQNIAGMKLKFLVFYNKHFKSSAQKWSEIYIVFNLSILFTCIYFKNSYIFTVNL